MLIALSVSPFFLSHFRFKQNVREFLSTFFSARPAVGRQTHEGAAEFLSLENKSAFISHFISRWLLASFVCLSSEILRQGRLYPVHVHVLP